MTIKNLHTPLVISFMDIMNIQVLLATLGLPIRVIVSDRSDPDRHDIGLIWFTLRRIIYRRAAFVVILSEAYRSWFQKNTGINPVVIPNPLTPESTYETPVNLRNQLGLSPTTKILVSMGRLDYFKGFDILLKAWHQINRSHPDWHLIIIGEGSLRTELEQLCVQLDISQKVSFIGLVKAPYVFLRQGNLFALSTRYESFGNVFIEAMYCGLPVVATNCTGAISEIIKDNYNGLLVPIDDPDALAKALHRLMDDDDLRLKMAANGSDVSNRYNIENIMAMWEKVIQG
jgi:glycosyltransferase involved in cell wall biosynthesis